MKLQAICTALIIGILATSSASAADLRIKRTKVVVVEQEPVNPFGFVMRLIALPFAIAETTVTHAVAIPVGVLSATREVIVPTPPEDPRRRRR